jgi:hypothetical protein
VTRVTRLCAAAGALAAVLTVGEVRAQTITTTSPLPDATEGTAYSLQFAASGGSGDFRWSTRCCPECGFPGCPPTTGLPPGLSFSPTGLLDGTPTASGSFSFWVWWANDGYSLGTFGLFVLHVRPSAAYSFSRWVPVAAHNGGLNGSAWRTDLGILNPTTSAANVEIDFYGGYRGIVSNTISVAAGAQLMLVDVVGQLGVSGQGALEILSDQPVTVTSHTYSRIPSDASCLANGTQGQDYPTLTASGGLAAGQSAYLAGLVENVSFRSNIGLVNTSLDSAEVLVELYDATGTLLVQYYVRLVPGEWEQRTQPFVYWAGQTAVDSGYARITVESGSGIFAFASVVDNITNDPTTVAMQP